MFRILPQITHQTPFNLLIFIFLYFLFSVFIFITANDQNPQVVCPWFTSLFRIIDFSGWFSKSNF